MPGVGLLAPLSRPSIVYLAAIDLAISTLVPRPSSTSNYPLLDPKCPSFEAIYTLVGGYKEDPGTVHPARIFVDSWFPFLLSCSACVGAL